MNCCDYNCNQGRNCPARVAPIGKQVDVSQVQPTRPHASDPSRGPRANLVRRLLQVAAVAWVFTILLLVCDITKLDSKPVLIVTTKGPTT